MFPRQQTAGTLGILAGISLALLFILFMTSGATMETFTDPAKALPYVMGASGRVRAIAALALITVALATIFLVGLAAKLKDKTPTRASGALYFGILGLAGHGLSGMSWWVGVPLIMARAAADQASAGTAWIAINALGTAFDSFGSLFVGLSILMAGWAMIGAQQMGSVLGWYGVAAGAVAVLTTCVPDVEILALVSFVIPIIWLVWAGNTLRTAS